MNNAGCIGEHTHLRCGLWAETVRTATKIENIVASANKAKQATMPSMVQKQDMSAIYKHLESMALSTMPTKSRTS